jgi:energy-coupling factor transporter ATP-binding protein EcfA2
VSLSVECEHLSFAYDDGGRVLPALVDVSLSVRPGASVALLGATGAGKSTLLQLVRGLLEPEMGLVRLDGVAPGEAGYAALRREIGLVFQMPEMQLFAMSAKEDVAFGPRQLGWAPQEVDNAVGQALERVGLPPEEFGARHPYSLSGGEQRRLALAGVLAMRPRVLLLDEPFASLDPGARRELGDVLRTLLATGMSMVLATHDVDQAWALCDERVILSGGRVVAAGSWEFGTGGEEALERHRLRTPSLVELWWRLGRQTSGAPRSAAEAAEELS